MTHFDGPPPEERSTSADEHRRLDFDTLVTVAEMINGIFTSRGLHLMIEVKDVPTLLNEEEIAREMERFYHRAGELAIGEDIKIGMTLLMSEANLRNQE